MMHRVDAMEKVTKLQIRERFSIVNLFTLYGLVILPLALLKPIPPLIVPSQVILALAEVLTLSITSA